MVSNSSDIRISKLRFSRVASICEIQPFKCPNTIANVHNGFGSSDILNRKFHKCTDAKWGVWRVMAPDWQKTGLGAGCSADAG